MDLILHMDPSPHMDQIPHVDQIPQMDQSPHMINNSVSQGRAKGYEYVHYSSNHYVHKSSKNFSAYSYAYPNPSYVKRSGLASMPPFFYGARRMMNSLPPLQMWVVKKNN